MLLKRELPHFSIRLREGSIFSDIVLIPKRGWRCPIKNTQTFLVPQIPHLIPPILHPSNANSNTHILSRQNLWFGFWECLRACFVFSILWLSLIPRQLQHPLQIFKISWLLLFDEYSTHSSAAPVCFAVPSSSSSGFRCPPRLHIPKEDFHDQVA